VQELAVKSTIHVPAAWLWLSRWMRSWFVPA
jgi:hypothetical protein